jgi:hypothetical protein
MDPNPVYTDDSTIIGDGTSIHPLQSGPGTTTRTFQFVIDGGGNVPSTGAKGQIYVPYAAVLSGWVLSSDQEGSAVIDVLTSTYANFPTTASIAGTDKPTLSSEQNAESLNLSGSGWGNVNIAASSMLQINLNSVATVTRLNLTLIFNTP